MYRMFRGGGCCGGGHANHGEQDDSHAGHHNGGCCGARGMDHGQMSHKNHEENNAEYFENSADMSRDMVQDTVCGMYVSKQDAIIKQVNGRTYYFCSQSCANEFEEKYAARKEIV